MLVASVVISGLGLGSMYGLLALGFHVTDGVQCRQARPGQHDDAGRGVVFYRMFPPSILNS